MTATACRTECDRCAGPMPLRARADARYCSNACRQAGYRERRRAEQERVAGEQAARIPAELTSRPRWVRYSSRKVPLRSEEHTSELQSRENLVCRLLLEKKKK